MKMGDLSGIGTFSQCGVDVVAATVGPAGRAAGIAAAINGMEES
jgi:hypothetical protein